MKIEFENRSEKILVLVVILVITLLGLLIMQSLSNKSLRQDLKENKLIVKELEKLNEDLTKQIDISEKQKEIISIKIDSVEKSEQYFKTKYYSTNEKLKIISNNYNNSSTSIKNELFTNAINN